jgi:hypothetical protein
MFVSLDFQNSIYADRGVVAAESGIAGKIQL